MTATEFLFIRHAPADTGGRLIGQVDVPILPHRENLTSLRNVVADCATRISSPAWRCRQTAALIHDGVWQSDPTLWEQDFGAWDGKDLGDIPDLGPLDGAALAAHRPPDGESFEDVCARIWPAIRAAAAHPGPVAFLVHAGTIRAALALALGQVAPALRFQIDPLSLTRITALTGGEYVISGVNQRITR